MRVTGVDGRQLVLVVPSGTSFLTFLRGVAEGWRDLGGRVMVACGPDLAGHVQRSWPVDVERIAIPFDRASRLPGTGRAAAQLRQLIVTRRPDLVHAHFAAAALVAALASGHTAPAHPCWLATFHGLHGAVAASWTSRLAGFAETFAARRMSTAWVLNEEDKAFLDRRLRPGVAERVSGYGVGCDLAHFDRRRFDRAATAAIRGTLGIPPESPVLIFVGRCTAFKGFDLATRVFENLARSFPDAHFVAVGAADALHASGLSQADWGRLRECRHAHLLGWQEDVSPWLAIADVCLFPSEREGMPVNLMEALAMGVPVVTLDARGCRDVVRDGVDGVVVRERSVTALLGEVASLIAAPDRRRMYAASALAGRERFDRRKFVESQIAAYAARLASRGQPAA
jgi:glycosyltransferase involved in cell wall biosynthesis